MAQMILSRKQKHIMDMEDRLMFAREVRGGSGMDREFGVGRCKLLCLEWIRNGVLLTAQGIMFNFLGSNMMEDSEKKRMCIYIERECMYIYIYI